jgi:hypothetical protein
MLFLSCKATTGTLNRQGTVKGIKKADFKDF